MVAPLPEEPPVDFDPLPELLPEVFEPLVPDDLAPEDVEPLGVDFDAPPDVEFPPEAELDEEEPEEEDEEVPLSGEFAPGSTTLPSATEFAVGRATTWEYRRMVLPSALSISTSIFTALGGP